MSSTVVEAVDSDALMHLFMHAASSSSDDWDDDFVARTIDEVVADMIPLPAPSDVQDKPNTDEPSTEDEDDEEIEPELSLEATAAMKRLRHREAMQRCRERKRSRMNALEKQQRRLKTILHERLLTLRMRDEPMDTNTRNEWTLEDLRKQFADIVRIKEELLDERQSLQQSLLAHQKFEKIATTAYNQLERETVLGEDNGTDTRDAPHRQRREQPIGRWVQYLDNEDPLFYEPESNELVMEHTRECFLRVRRLQDSFFNRVAGLSIQDTYCLGWHAEHTVARSPEGRLELRFRFTRRVPLARISLTEIQRETWNIMKDPVQNARLYSSLVVCKIVQFIGKNAFIFIRNAPDKDKRLHIRYFSLHSQMEYRTHKDERAIVTLMKILDKDPHMMEAPTKTPSMPVIWLKQGTLYLGFTEKLESNEIEIEYGGSTMCMSEQHAAYLLTEVGGALMRWEHMVIPQRLLF